MTIFERVRAVGLPEGQYVIIGSGTMEALGIRRAGDLDIVVLPELYEELRARGSLKEEARYDQVFLEQPGVTIIPRLEWESYPTTTRQAIDSALIIEGVRFMNLDELIKFKTALGREKDLKDIELIRAYQGSH